MKDPTLDPKKIKAWLEDRRYLTTAVSEQERVGDSE